MNKCLFLAGASGSGKSTIIKQLINGGFETINVDDSYEELLNAANLGGDQKNFTSDQLSQAAKLMQQARKTTTDKLNKHSLKGNNLIIDGTGASSAPLLAKKQEMESLGYKTFLIIIYSSLVTALERNKNRNRSLLPFIIMQSWKSVMDNINIYKQEFGNNFVLINNDGTNPNKDFDPDFIKKLYFDTISYTSKPKTPEEAAKSKAKKEELNNSIMKLAKNPPQTVNVDQAKSKINDFLK